MRKYWLGRGRILLKLNCNVEILLDAAKKEVHKKLEEKVQALKLAIINENATAALSGTQQTSQDGEPPAHPNEAIIQKLVEFQTSIKGDNGLIDLIKEGEATGCNQKLNEIAMADVLAHNASYVMGTVDTEHTPPISLFMIEDQANRPATAKKK